jgi:hypothetical protein
MCLCQPYVSCRSFEFICIFLSPTYENLNEEEVVQRTKKARSSAPLYHNRYTSKARITYQAWLQTCQA